jgi:hypothetical protein
MIPILTYFNSCSFFLFSFFFFTCIQKKKEDSDEVILLQASVAFSKGEREYAAYLSEQVCSASAKNIEI